MLNITKERDTVIIRLPRMFGFPNRTEFRQATIGNPQGTKYRLDFQEVEKLDSAALGMLLILRESAGGMTSDISLVNTRAEVRQLLVLANFQSLFKIP
ncbi:MAG: STAS domain-containing protein [Magnetococcales bacterium]|nr:STAS domain-containing protein [Magnetococcales bacterium]